MYCNQTYKNSGWKGWTDFLGTKYRSSKFILFLSFEESKKYAKSLGLQSSKEWFALYDKEKIKKKTPKYANEHYQKKGWKGWPDFLGYKPGTNRKVKEFYSFSRAKKFVKKLNLQTVKMYSSYCEGNYKNLPSKPDLLPKAPSLYYKKEWRGWPDYLGKKKA